MALMGWWPLNNDFNDYSGNNKHLKNDNVILDKEGKIGKCAIFNGDAMQRLYHKNFTQIPNNFSWSVWVKQELAGSNTQFIVSQGRDVLQYGINICSHLCKLSFFIGTDYIKTDLDISKWTHVTIVGDISSLKIYINGELFMQRPITEIHFGNATDYALVIGKMSFGYSQAQHYFPFSGRVNDVKIYNHCLSEKEIKDDYNSKIIVYKFHGRHEESTDNLLGKINENDMAFGNTHTRK